MLYHMMEAKAWQNLQIKIVRRGREGPARVWHRALEDLAAHFANNVDVAGIVKIEGEVRQRAGGRGDGRRARGSAEHRDLHEVRHRGGRPLRRPMRRTAASRTSEALRAVPVRNAGAHHDNLTRPLVQRTHSWAEVRGLQAGSPSLRGGNCSGSSTGTTAFCTKRQDSSDFTGSYGVDSSYGADNAYLGFFGSRLA